VKKSGEPIPARVLREYLGVRPTESRFLFPPDQLETLWDRGERHENILGMFIVNDYGTNISAVIQTRRLVDYLGTRGFFVSRDPHVGEGFASLHDILDGLFRLSPTRSATLFLAGGRYPLCIGEAFEMAVRKAVARRAALHVVIPEFAIQGQRDLDAIHDYLKTRRVSFRLCLDDTLIDTAGSPDGRTLVHASIFSDENAFQNLYPRHRERFYSNRTLPGDPAPLIPASGPVYASTTFAIARAS
jgi:hypothetical protein